MDKNFTLPSLLRSFIFILIGVGILLMGMKIVSSFTFSITSSYFDVIFVALGLMFITSKLRISQLVGQNSVNLYIGIIVSLTLCSILFARINVFTISDGESILSSHDEHNLTINRIKLLADELRSGSIISAHKSALFFGQYAYTYLYSSLMYVFGGDVITHICVWNGMHLGIEAVLSVLIASAMGIKERETLRCVLLLVSLQPIFMTLFAYNRNIVGEVFLLSGLLIFVKSSDKPMRLLLLLPIYGFLFYSFRLQYLLIAVAMFFVFSIIPRTGKQKASLLGVMVAFCVMIYLTSRFNWATDVNEDLNVENYTSSYSNNVIKNLLLAVIGKFPWTNLFNDNNWTYHMFVSLQAPMMLVLYYYNYKLYKHNLKEFILNPVLLCGVFLLMAGFISSTHTTYLAVAAPMLIIGVSSVPLTQILRSYFKISMVYIVLSLTWFAMGLTNSGAISG